MDIEQLRLCAGSLRQFLAARNFTLSHNQSLDLLAAVSGFRNWPEALALREKASAVQLDLNAAVRLAKRIVAKGGPSVEADELLRVLQSGEDVSIRTMIVWPDGPMPGIYVTSDGLAVERAIARYSKASGEALFFTSGVDYYEGNAIELGETGIFSAGLARAPSGTLLVMNLAIGGERWDELRSRMTAAWNAADGGMRVLVFCTTPTPESLYADVSLLTHTKGEPAPSETNWLMGVVDTSGEFRKQVPFAPERRKVQPLTALPPSLLTLPAAVADNLDRALGARNVGVVVAGMLAEAGENYPLEVIAAMLPRLQRVGPIGRIPRHNSYDGRHPVPEAVAMLPVFSSVESALAAGCAVIVFDMAFYDESQEILEYVHRALFVVGVKALGVGRGISNALSSMTDADQSVDLVTAAVCTGRVRGKASKPLTWDMYTRVGDLAASNAKRKQPRDFEEMFDAARVIRREDQIAEWIEAGTVTEKSIRKDFPYLRIPRKAARTISA